MKNLKKWSFILIPLMLTAIISCKNSATGSFVGSDKKPLTITVTSNDNIKLFKNEISSARVISPDAFTLASGLKFYLWGEATNGQKYGPELVDVVKDADNDHIGKVVLNMDCFNWNMTLVACNTTPSPVSKEKILEEGVLIGYGAVDMTNEDNIKFTLSPRGLEKPGNINMKLKFETGTPVDGYKITANLYDISSGRAVKGKAAGGAYSEDLSQIIKAADASSFNIATEQPYTANGKKIAPGTYSFVVEFSKDGKSFITNEKIIILPGKTIDKTVTILNPIGYVPDPPTNFTAVFNKYIKETYSTSGTNVTTTTTLTNEAEEATKTGYYVVHFTWTAADNVKTEKNFELQLAEIVDDTATVTAMSDSDEPAAKTTFEGYWTAANTAGKAYIFDSMEDLDIAHLYKGGSLFHDSESVDLYLELGKRYIARLYSKNDAGLSTKASYVAITPVETAATGDPAVALTTINRYRVKYWNRKGIWNYGEEKGTESDAAKFEIIDYWSQSNKSYTVLNPVKQTVTQLGDTDKPYLYKGTSDWIHWTTRPSSNIYPAYGTGANSAVYTPEAYTSFKNLDLYANYSGNVETWDDSLYFIDEEWLTIFGEDVDITQKNQFSKSVITDSSNPKSPTVTLTIPDTGVVGTWVYDKVWLDVLRNGQAVDYNPDPTYALEQAGAARGTANTFTLDMDQFDSGMYYFIVNAKYKDAIYDKVFTVYLTD